MVNKIYPSELHLNKANTSYTKAAFQNLHLSILTNIYDRRDDFDFEIVNVPFLDGDVPRSTSYGVYISQLIRFSRASSPIADFKVSKGAKIRNRYNQVLSTLAINCLLRNFLNKAIGIINIPNLSK